MSPSAREEARVQESESDRRNLSRQADLWIPFKNSLPSPSRCTRGSASQSKFGCFKHLQATLAQVTNSDLGKYAI